MRRRAPLVIFATLVVAGASSALVAAQGTPPTVVVAAGARSTAIEGAEALRGGPVRIEYRSASRRTNADLTLLALRPEIGERELRAALLRNPDPRQAKRLGTFMGGADVPASRARVQIVTVRPGTRYAVVNTRASSPRRWTTAFFTVGEGESGAAAPEPVATVTMRDYRFTAPATLPRRGVIRVRNEGGRLHHAIAFRARERGSARRAAAALVRDDETAFAREVEPERFVALQGITSGGTQADVQAAFARTGRYVLVCFLEDGERGNPSHSTLGMVETFRVR